MNNRVYAVTAGGLGDTIYNYLSPAFDTSYFAALKAADPECRTKLYVWSNNAQSGQLATCDPSIDEIELNVFSTNWHQLTLADAGGYRRLSGNEKATLAPAAQAIRLDAAETEVAEGIKAGGPFVVIHPSAGDGMRSWGPRVDLKAVIDLVCDKGYVAVLVGSGGSFEYARAGFHNLLDAHSCRLHAHLAACANRFVGSISAYSVAATAFGVKSLLFGPGAMRALVYRGPGPFEHYRQAGADVRFWGETPGPLDYLSEWL